MKRRFVIAFVALFILALAAPAFAADLSPFQDVPAKHWAYDAVKTLAKAGIVEGYGDGTFRGQATITRYEMAIITANAMTKMAKADAQQKALIEKLANEFNGELVKLGARVAKLEAAQPNIKMGGQARITYGWRDDAVTSAVSGLNKDRDSYTTYRFRLEGTVKFSDKFMFFGRLRAQDYDVETGATNTGTGSFNQVYMEQFWFSLRDPLIKDATLTVGRQGLLFGKGGVAYAVGAKDMIMLDGGKPDFSWKLALKNDASTTKDNRQTYMQVGTKLGQDASLSLMHVEGVASYEGQTSLTSLAFDSKIGKDVSIYGEYAKNTDFKAGDNKVYWFGLTNGNPMFHPGLGFAASWMKPGANAQSLIYRHYGGDNTTFVAPWSVADSQLNAVLGANNAVGGAYWLQGTKGWEFYDQRCLEKNVMLLTQIGTAKDVNSGKRLSTYAIFQLYTFF